jgi:hypothetical protein
MALFGRAVRGADERHPQDRLFEARHQGRHRGGLDDARADANKDRVGGRQSVTPTAALPGLVDLPLVSATSLGAGAVGVIYQPP